MAIFFQPTILDGLKANTAHFCQAVVTYFNTKTASKITYRNELLLNLYLTVIISLVRASVLVIGNYIFSMYHFSHKFVNNFAISNALGLEVKRVLSEYKV